MADFLFPKLNMAIADGCNDTNMMMAIDSLLLAQMDSNFETKTNQKFKIMQNFLCVKLLHYRTFRNKDQL